MNDNATGDTYCKTHGWLMCACSPELTSSGEMSDYIQSTGIVNPEIDALPAVLPMLCSGIFKPGYVYSFIREEKDIYDQRALAERRLRFFPKRLRNWFLGM